MRRKYHAQFKGPIIDEPFLKKVLEKACERVAVFTGPDLHQHSIHGFWRSFAEVGITGTEAEQQRECEKIRDYFFTISSPAQKEQFLRSQHALSERVDKTLLDAGVTDVFQFEKTSQEFFDQAYSLLDYVVPQREKFLPVKALSVFFDFPAYAIDVLKRERDVSKENLGWSLSRTLEKEFHHSYLRPATCIGIFNHLSDADQNAALKSVLVNNAQSAPKTIPVSLVDARTIRTASNIAAEFMKETQRPARGGHKTTTGGRAGLGAQKPDLWKPEKK